MNRCFMVFEFDNSREFLRTYIDSLPKKGWGEIQRWADHLGLQASYISQVLAGTKTFNMDQGLKLAKHLGLKETELDYLMLVMEKERAASHETKKYFCQMSTYRRSTPPHWYASLHEYWCHTGSHNSQNLPSSRTAQYCMITERSGYQYSPK